METMSTYEQDFYRASDRLREVRKRLDALARRWRSGDPSVTTEMCNAMDAEHRAAQREFFRCKAIAAQAARAQQRKGMQ